MNTLIETISLDPGTAIPPRADLLVIECPSSPSSDFSAAVSVPVASVVATLQRCWRARAASSTEVDRIAIAVTIDESLGGSHSEAFFEALRGVCGSLTLELSPAGLRINVVRAHSLTEAQNVFEYLADARAVFVAGSTIDLTQEDAA